MTDLKVCICTLQVFVILTGNSKITADVRDEHSCTYTFNVWKPEDDILGKIKEIDLKLGNITRYVDNEILKLKHSTLAKLKSCENCTGKLEKDFFNIDTGENIKSMEDLNSIRNKLIKIQNDVESMRGKSYHTYSQENSRDLRDVTSNDDVSFDMLHDSVIDLKAEWILIKRDIFDIHKELAHMRKGQNDIHNETQNLFNSVASLSKHTDKVQSKVDHTSTRGFILNSNVNELKKLVVSFQEKEDNRSGEISQIKHSIDIVRTDMHKQTRELESMKTQISYPEMSSSMRSDTEHKTKHGPVVKNVTPIDCEDIMSQGYTASGVYQIRPNNSKYMDSVYCEFVNNTAYTVIQRRLDGLLSFDRRWIEYKFGFGNLYGEHWIGNYFIHLMSNQRRYVLRIDIWDWEGERGYAEYSNFRIDDDQHQYQLHVSGYSGNAGDSLSYHNDIKFSTEDSDNDLNMRNCAADNKSGWWFNKCYLANLNGVYRAGWYTHVQSSHADGVVWYTWKNSEHYSLRKVEMKMKRVT